MNRHAGLRVSGAGIRTLGALAVVLVTAGGRAGSARGEPVAFSRIQSPQFYIQNARPLTLEVPFTYSFDPTLAAPWQSPVTISGAKESGEQVLHVAGHSRHAVALHPGEAPSGLRWDYEFTFPGPLDALRRQRRFAMITHPGSTEHVDLSFAGVMVMGDPSGKLRDFLYIAMGQHRPRPVLLYHMGRFQSTSDLIHFSEAIIVVDPSGESFVLVAAVGGANQADLAGAAIRRSSNNAMMLDVGNLGNWRDAGGTGIVADVELDAAVTLPNEFMPDLIGHNAYLEVLVGNDVVRGDLTQVPPELIDIPEPTTLSLLALGSLVALRRRRR